MSVHDLDVIDARQARRYTTRAREKGLNASRRMIFGRIANAVESGETSINLWDMASLSPEDTAYFTSLGYRVNHIQQPPTYQQISLPLQTFGPALVISWDPVSSSENETEL
jgi:hypothetical protein